jgi:amino acid transporter
VALEAKTVAVYVSDLTSISAPTAITLVALVISVAVALLAVRTSTLVTGLFLCIEMLAVFVLIALGMSHPVRSLGSALVHPIMLNSAGVLTAPTLGALALGAVSAVYATAGGNQAVVFGEELKDPHRNMGRVIIFAGMVGAFGTALPVIAVVIGTADLTSILKSPAPFSAFVASFAGPIAGRVLSACVALAILNALIVQVMFTARLFFSMGRDRIFSGSISRILADVHGPSGSPRAATLIAGVLSALCCLIDTHVLVIFVTGIVTYTLGLVCLAVLMGRSRGFTGRPGYWRAPLHPLVPLLGLALAIALCVADLFDADAGRPSMLILGAVVAVAILWYHFVLSRRPGGWTPRLG